LSATFFLEKYRSLVEGAYIIPGYAGDLLVRTKTRPDRKVFRGRANDHRSLRDAYDTAYFLQDCGGHAGFKAWGGKRLTDPRLIAVYHIGHPGHGMRVLDVGCGRGELAYACFEAGADVTGVDYAASAIAICRQTYGAQCGERLRFVETDILQFEPSAQFDLILASDFVEHIAADALDAVLARIAQLLAPGGRLVLHTWPNRLAYDYQYEARRRQVLRGGGYLPRNQRTYYEDLMHVNEQTPAGLRRALRRNFPFATVWVGSGEDPLGSATKDAPMRSRLRQHESLFAVASAAAVSMSGIEQSLRQQRLNPAGLTGVRIIGASAPATMRCGETTCGSVDVANMSIHSLRSFPPYPVRLSYHWYRDGALALHDGLRSELVPALEPGSTNAYPISIQSPLDAGQYELALTLVQEDCFWFDDALPSCTFRQSIDVT
jgi:2-polyprenyl-3-methyl-5-hydroxy-6-metoxy-1,4-benzoquinol methylase